MPAPIRVGLCSACSDSLRCPPKPARQRLERDARGDADHQRAAQLSLPSEASAAFMSCASPRAPPYRPLFMATVGRGCHAHR